MTNLIGKTISHYKIIEQIGSGSMGIVYKAEDIELKRLVALKFLPPEFVRDEDFKERFLNEAKTASALDHANICTIYEIGKTDPASGEPQNSQMFIAMAYYEGETLKDKIKKGNLKTNEIINIITQIAEGLARAHESGIVHRDIKPANIIITQRGEVKIVDFGLAKAAGQAKITKTGSPLGTVSYMSPEQAKGQPIDHRTDIWSLGILLYEMLTGKIPFKGENAHSILYSILNDEPALIENSQTKIFNIIFQKTLAKNPDERYQNVTDLILNFQNVKSQSFETDEDRKIKNKKIYFLTGILVVTLLTILFFFFDLLQDELPPWLQENVRPVRLTSDVGTERGRISPDGNYLVYFSEGGKFKIKDLQTSEERTIARSTGTGNLAQPIWSPDGLKIALTTWPNNGTSYIEIYSRVLGSVLQRIPVAAHAFYPVWAPDNKRIAFNCNKPVEQLIIVNIETHEKQIIPIEVRHITWSPDAQKIAFITQEGPIRYIDVQTEVLSDTLKGAKPVFAGWSYGGLAWSTDGRYLVYTGYSDRNRELFALPMNPEDYSVSGDPIQITHFNGIGEPFWPTFTTDGNCLSYGILEDHPDIHMMDFSIKVKNAEISGNGKIIANSRRREAEPCWLPDGNGVVFVSEEEGQPDLFINDFNSLEEQPKRLTFSEFREKYPQISPNGDFVSFYSDEAIWGIPITGGQKEKIVTLQNNHTNFCCGRHVWSSDGFSIYALIPDEEIPRYYSKLVKIDVSSNRQEILAEDLTLDSDIALSPDGKLLAILGISELYSNINKISIMDLHTKAIEHLIERPTLFPRSCISWTKDGKYILHDIWNKETDLLENQLLPIDGSQPIPIKLDIGNIKGNLLIGPIDPYSGKKILITQLIEESDIYILGLK